jgi:cytochrome c-type biogenesis protein CcmH/NrfG
MHAEGPVRTAWSSIQTYTIALACFALSATMGYLFHEPGRAAPAGQQSAIASQAQPGVKPDAHPSPEQLQQMADKKADPLLAKLRENPNDPAVLADLGKTYMYVRDFKKSADFYERSVAIKPDPRVLTTLGGVYHLAGADDKAIDAWQRALKLSPGYADALYNLGLVKWQSQSDPQAAIRAWTELLKANPDHPQRAKVEEMIARAREHAKRGLDTSTAR